MKKSKSVLFTGVGGQGIILASKILANGLIEAGYDVKMSEVHGMAQRGGSVTTQVRFGEKVHSPIIGSGNADVIVAFEKMEAVRWMDHLKLGGKYIVNDYKIPSAPILMGNVDYPENIIEFLEDKTDVIYFNATELAKELGNIRTMNVIMMGALAKALNIDEIDWNKIIEMSVKEQFVQINKEAFKIGYNMKS